MSENRPTTRRDLMKPMQLLGFGFAAAAFSGIIALVSMGFFQDLSSDEHTKVIVVALIVAGIAFIVTLVVIALLMLAVDPTKVTAQVDRAVLLPEGEDEAESGDESGAGSEAEVDGAGADPAEPRS